MNANFQDAELDVVMGDQQGRHDRLPDLTAPVEPSVEQPAVPNSPSSAVCNTNEDDFTAPSPTTENAHPPAHDGGALAATLQGDDTDSTPRSEVPSVPDAVAAGLFQHMYDEPSYFSPQPLRVYSSHLPRSASVSTDPSPTNNLNASSSAANVPERFPRDTATTSTHALHLDRPVFQRDQSTASTSNASAVTVRANSVDPTLPFTPYSKIPRDGPVYPNQSYAALQFQSHYSRTEGHPPMLRARSSHPAHGHSISGMSNFGLPNDHRDIMESGARTAGNSPAGSPGLFSPITPPLRHSKHSYDYNYSTPWLHHTHRQAPKETHVADVEFDPVSGRKLINQYEICDELGRGVHGKVKLGRNLQRENPQDDSFVAIKIVDRYSKRRRLGKNTSHEDKIKREIAILKKARHPNIVSLLEVIDDPSRKKVYIVLEHVKLGEVKWRTEGAKEICLVEWRRFQRESEGIFDNENAAMEDEKIIKLAQMKIQRQQRRKAKESRDRRRNGTGEEAWSFELGGDSEEDYSESSLPSQTSTRREDKTPSRLHYTDRREPNEHYEDNMETAFRSTTPVTSQRHDPLAAELEGTMYGAYDTEAVRGRTPSIAGSSSSHFTDGEDEVPEHFRHVPLMAIQAAREAFRDTVLGLEYLHYQGVIHRDIKPANLLQTEDHRIKISDFGVSYLGRQQTEESNGDQSESDFPDADEAVELAKTVGTPAFYAPELCRTDMDVDSPPVTQQIDVWALGVTLYCLIYGRVPFHDHNTFVLMRMITDTEPYLARYRLKAVAEQSRSRPSSHGRGYSMTTSRRAPHDLEYEEVDENLRDLLRRLLVKDPRHRITIKEIKRHPWLTQGIDNFDSWVEETDPGRSFQGRKIEVSRDDVDQAVVPITFMDRTRSIVRKGIDLVHGVTKNLTRGGSRRRAQSTTMGDATAGLSAHSSSSTISQEGRRPSLAGGAASLFEALSRSREPEHPLSQSVTASPEAKESHRFSTSRTASPAYSVESNEPPALLAAARPHPPERAFTSLTISSNRTVRQSDLSKAGRPVSPIPPNALPGTPVALDTPTGSQLSGLFGGGPRRFITKLKERESHERLLRLPREHSRTKSIDRLIGSDDDPHGAPSLAISTTMASGHVDQPDVLKELSPSLARTTSPNPSGRHTPDWSERAASRQSSVSSLSSRLQRNWAAANDLDVGPMLSVATSTPTTFTRETSDERFSRAKEEFVRRKVREEALVRERPQSATYQRPPSSLSQAACPPSPDDFVPFERQKVEDFLNEQHPSSLEASPGSYPINIESRQTRGLNSSSSEDHFTSMSQSTSNPSIPSVASANSSVAAEDCIADSFLQVAPGTSGESIHINQFDVPTDDPAGYDGDHALESEDDDESDDDDGFIMMGRKKPTSERSRSESVSNAELARSSIRKEIITTRRKSARSGSNGTVKKIAPLSESGDEKTPEP